MWRLVLDSIRRQKNRLIVAAAFLAFAWLSTGTMRTWTVATTLAGSAAVACFLGPLVGLMTFTAREIRQLPVSSRHIWRAIWFRSAVVSPVVTSAAKLPVLIFAPAVMHAIGAGSMALSCLYDFAYAGASTVWLVLIAQRRSRSGVRRWRSVTGSIATLMLLFAAPIWPFVLRQHLATRWTDVSGPNVITLLALFGVAAGTFFYRPGATTASRVPFGASRQGNAGAARRSRTAGGATGLMRLVVNELAWTAIIGAMIVSTLGLVEYFVDLVTSGGHTRSFVRTAWLLPFDARMPTTTPDDANLLVWLAFFFLTGTDRFGEMLRHLRALPLGVARLNAILVAWPLLIWSLIWAALVSIHAIVVQAPVQSLRPALFLSLVGVSALASAVKFRWGPRSVIWIIPGVVFSRAFIYPELLSRITPASLALVGVAGVLAALALNVRTLARSAPYAPRHANRVAPPVV